VYGDLVIDESIAVERINGRPLNTLVYQGNVKNKFGMQEIEADEIGLASQEFLSKISTINKNLQLEGGYRIDGAITIKSQLSSRKTS
jgi:hypothetical protein